MAAASADMVHRELRSVLDQSSARSEAYAFKDRIKPWYSVRDKVLRKRAEGRLDYEAWDVKDASGFRIVTLFNAEIPHRLDLMLGLVSTGEGCLVKGLGHVFEIEIHTNRREDDPLAITRRVNEVVERWGLAGKLQSFNVAARFSSYSSVHLVLGFPSTDRMPNGARSEIQIRSVFEEAWSEISHKLGYGPDKAAAAVGGVTERTRPQAWKQHLDALKSLADGCAQYSDLIAQEAGWRPGAGSGGVSAPRSVESSNEEWRTFFSALPPDLFNTVEAAMHERDEAEAMRGSEGQSLPEAAAAFRSAGDKFERLLEHFERNSVPSVAERHVNGVRAECAYCYMHSRDAELVNRAEQLWRQAIKVDPEFVAALHRLGSLLLNSSRYEEAGQVLDSARAVAEPKLADGGQGVAERMRLIHRDLGINYWRLSQFADSKGARIALLRNSVEVTLRALVVSDNEANVRTMAANALYCLAELSELDAEGAAAHSEQAVRLLGRLRALPSYGSWAPGGAWSVMRLDSIMRGEAAFGNKAVAVEVARELIKRLGVQMAQLAEIAGSRGRALDLLDADERDIYLVASELVAISAT